MQKTKRSNTLKKHQNTRKRTHTQLQHKSHFDSILAPKCLPNAPPKRLKNEQKNKTKKEPKKRAKKELNMDEKISTCRSAPIKPDPAVNGKRRLKTLFVIQICLGCICSCYFLTGFFVWKSFRRTTKIRRSLSLPLIGRFWPLLGRSWPLLDRFWGTKSALKAWFC